MSAPSKPDARRAASTRSPITTTRRSFVGSVGAVVLGCASDDSNAPLTEEMQASNGGNPPANGGAPSSMPAAGNDSREPMGTAAEPGDQPAQPTELDNDPQNEGNPEGASTPEASNDPASPVAPQPGTCTLYPEQTEGPFYVDGDLLRSDIREGKPGTLLTLDLLVVSANGCAPIANAAVDIWHCDAAGVYSGYQGQLGGQDTRGQVFLRGTQITGSDGRVRFQTIYPGWYPGRTTHIHFKVHLPANREATSQLYFEESLNSEVYGINPYAAHGQKDTSNQADGIGRGTPLTPVMRTAQGYAGSMTLTVAG